MDTVDDLKKDIVKKNAFVALEKERLKEQINNGMFDDVDEVLENPKTKDYYQNALDTLNKENLSNTVKISEDNLSLWKRIKENFKKIVLK